MKYATSLAAELHKHKKAREKLLLEAKRRKKQQQQLEAARRTAEPAVITINDDSKPNSPVSNDNEPGGCVPEHTNNKCSNNNLAQAATDCLPHSPSRQVHKHIPPAEPASQQASPVCQPNKAIVSPASASRPVAPDNATPNTTARCRLTNLPMPPGMQEDEVDSDMDKTPYR